MTIKHPGTGSYAIFRYRIQSCCGFTLAESVQRAKEYISGALAAMLDLGQGSGPMMHNFDLTSSFAEEKNLFERKKEMRNYTTQMDAARRASLLPK